jgi:hypothetical protein
MTVSTITVDRRKLLLTFAAGLAATATAGIAIEAPANADPIFAAIDAHREAVTEFETIHAAWVEEALFASNGAQLPLQLQAPDPLSIALSAQFAAGHALIDTSPTTRAGLRAFESYLQEDSSSMLRQSIWYPSTVVEGTTFKSRDGSPEAVAWLIAKRAVEIDRAA